MSKMAILVDGGFFHRRANKLWGNNVPAAQRAEELIAYCRAHANHYNEHAVLYRIFYYDCPPSNAAVYHPYLKKQIELKKTPLFKWMTEFHSELMTKRKVALRFGRLSDAASGYTLSSEAIKKLCNGKLSWDGLKESDFVLEMKQKGVDMRIGVDISSIAYKKQVDQIVLIAGDSDFVPAAKVARREGIDFILDPMYNTINRDLQEHIDGLRSRPKPSLDAKKGNGTDKTSK
jgi:uncharacterized LabA/DUF88 family protein